VAVVTLTITEKGYCHIPATGHLDQSNAELNDDIRGSVPPKTAIGLLAAGIELRRQLGAGDVTLISCDNIPSNGLLLRNVLTEFAEQRSAELARWLREHVRFPSTMVDRIVPASTPDDVRFAREVCGVEDLAPVVGEPFRQWVIEDSFASRRPDWDAAGAAFVADVHPYELMKMRLLNAAQSSFAYFGALSGLEHTFDAARDPVLRAVVRRMIVDESSPTVPPVPGVEIDKYIDLVFQRISNVAIRHRNHQVATDGSQKIVQRLLNPIRDRRQSGAGFDLLASAVAGWMAYLLAATPMFGSRWQASDPWAQEIERLAMKTGDKSLDLVRAIVGIKAIFGEGLSDGPFCAAVAAHLSGLLALNPRGYLAGLVQQSSLS
jgi:fructuronate reductase